MPYLHLYSLLCLHVKYASSDPDGNSRKIENGNHSNGGVIQIVTNRAISDEVDKGMLERKGNSEFLVYVNGCRGKRVISRWSRTLLTAELQFYSNLYSCTYELEQCKDISRVKSKGQRLLREFYRHLFN